LAWLRWWQWFRSASGWQQLASSRLSKSGLFDSIFVTGKSNLRGPGAGPPANRHRPQKRDRWMKTLARKISKLPNVIESLSADTFFH